MMTHPSSVYWTRSLDDWQQDRQLVSAIGYPYVHLPCIYTVPLSVTDLPEDCDTVVVTSSRAAHTIENDRRLQEFVRKSQELYTFGARTAEALKKSGFGVTVPEGIKNGISLIRFVSTRVPPGSTVHVLTAADPAVDYQQAGDETGLRITVIPLYRTIGALRLADGRQPSQAEIQALASSLFGVVCFASPSAVRPFMAVFWRLKGEPLRGLVAVCIGETTAAECARYFDLVEISPEQSCEKLAETARDFLNAHRNG